MLTVLLPQERHEEGAAWLARGRVHLSSSLAWAEVHAVLGRYVRAGLMTPELARDGSARLARGRWDYVETVPDRTVVRELAIRWPLRGADLWHLALVKTLWTEQPDIRILTFDHRLAEAAAGEGLAVSP